MAVRGISLTPPPVAGPPVAVLPRLETVVNLVEQYFHPSNGGRWGQGLTCHRMRRAVAGVRRRTDDGRRATDAWRLTHTPWLRHDLTHEVHLVCM